MRKYQVRFRGGITEKEHSYLAGILPDTTDGRKLALDQRLLNPALPDDPGSKANACADKVYEIWAQTREQRSTQLIFSDLATPGTGAWNVYDDIRDKLIARGVPKEEIAYIHDANTDAKRRRCSPVCALAKCACCWAVHKKWEPEPTCKPN